MSKKHPVVVITGSSGAGTSTVKKALEAIFHRQKINPVVIEGDSFHRYDREAMREQVEVAHAGQAVRTKCHAYAGSVERLQWWCADANVRITPRARDKRRVERPDLGEIAAAELHAVYRQNVAAKEP